MNICTKCSLNKPTQQFRIYTNKSIRSICKSCDNESDKQRKINNRKKYNESTIKLCEICDTSKSLKDFTKLKKNYKKSICLICYPSFLTQEKTEWCQREHNRNPKYRLKKSLAARLRNVMLKGNNTTLDFIGCNMDFLKYWFEYNFTNDMTWDNYGSLWNIDHTIPIDNFDLTIENEKFLCWNWTNLSPMLVSENCSKKNTIIQSHSEHQKQQLNNFLKEKGSTTKWFSVEYCILLKI